MKRIIDMIATIKPLDSEAMEKARARQQQLTKPAREPGSTRRPGCADSWYYRAAFADG